MVCASIVIDVGLLRTDGARLQNALDSGALAAAQSLPATSTNVGRSRAAATITSRPTIRASARPSPRSSCIIGADPGGGPHLIDMPEVCNVAAGSTWICTAELCWAPCDPVTSPTDMCNAVVLEDFGRPAVHLRQGSGRQQRWHRHRGGRRVHGTLRADQPRGRRADHRSHAVHVGPRGDALDGADAVLEAYDPTVQHVALGLIGPSSELYGLLHRRLRQGAGERGADAAGVAERSTNVPAVAQVAAGAGSLVINKPTGTASGDLLIAAITLNGNVTIPSGGVPAGWTRLRVVPNGANLSLVTYWKVATGAEPANYTWTLSASGRADGAILRITGEDPANPIDTSSQSTGTGTALSATGVNTAGDQELLVAVFGTTAESAITPGRPQPGHRAVRGPARECRRPDDRGWHARAGGGRSLRQRDSRRPP